MKLVAANCPNCGANMQVDEEKEQCTCLYCGTNILIQDAVQAPIQAPVAVKTRNSEYDLKLALAKNMEQIYFISGANAVHKNGLFGYDAVMSYYKDVEMIGSDQTSYWLCMSRFFVKGNLQGFYYGTRFLLNRQKFINSYALYMNNAIRFCEVNTANLEEEKNKTIQMLYVELRRYPERKYGCYIATAVYNSYDCPQVWVLRRFRDHYLAKSWYGRAFIKVYYATSPILVKIFGQTKIFKKVWKSLLDKFIIRLQHKGVESTRYEDE